MRLIIYNQEIATDWIVVNPIIVDNSPAEGLTIDWEVVDIEGAVDSTVEKLAED